jgi:hypothetical protein
MKKSSKIVSGFSLVEVAMALAIASFTLITLMALLPVGIQSYRDADAQSAMVNLATMIVRDLAATPSSGTSPRFGFSIPAAGGTSSGVTPQTVYVDTSEMPAGTYPYPGTPPTAKSIYRISVFFLPPATAGQTMSTVARVLITFPASADPQPKTVPTTYSNMFQTMVSLNRN